jgi:hypothetical protein
MSKKEFLLFVNANGIHYKVCKKFKGTSDKLVPYSTCSVNVASPI